MVWCREKEPLFAHVNLWHFICIENGVRWATDRSGRILMPRESQLEVSTRDWLTQGQSMNVFNFTKLTSPPTISVSLQNTEDHLTFLITVPTALFLFLSIFILVCIESVFKRMLRLFSLLIWACLVTMGYLFMFSGGRLSPWDQVDRFLYFLCECSGWSTRVQQMAFKCLQLSNLELRIL